MQLYLVLLVDVKVGDILTSPGPCKPPWLSCGLRKELLHLFQPLRAD